ncbi:MAG TPA: acetate--CoA ligase family protein, partial [Verrucomicrobiaceae bacterium]
MEIRSLRALHGPNIWSARPVLEMNLVIFSPVFADLEAADRLFLAHNLDGTRDGLGEISRSDMRIVNWLGSAIVKLQTAGQTPVAFHGCQSSAVTGAVRLAVEFQEEPLGRAAVDFAVRWLRSLPQMQPFDLAKEWEAFLDFAYDARIGNSTGPTVEAAIARGIPALRLDTESLVQLGHGWRQRRIRRAATDGTGMIANDVSTDKSLTKSLLQEIGIPLPRGRAVSDENDAVAAAVEAGWPVVVKPQDADYGNGVTMRIKTEGEVRRAWHFARQHSEGVLVEHHVPGHLFRLLVVGKQLIAAVRREPWFVVGDGQHTLLELIEHANHDPRRGAGYESPILKTSRETGAMPVLTPDGRTHDSVPVAGETVVLRHDVYLKCGGIHLDQADTVHPEFVRLALDATRCIGLDIAGLDFIALDLTLPPDQQEMAVLEVNSEPSIALHLEPLCIPPRPVGEAIVGLLFPPCENGRIPVIAVLGNADDFPMAQERALELPAQHDWVGLASRDGAWLNGRLLGESAQSTISHVRRLWRHPRTEAVVVFVTLDDVLREGLPFDRCDELVECDLDTDSPSANE